MVKDGKVGKKMSQSMAHQWEMSGEEKGKATVVESGREGMKLEAGGLGKTILRKQPVRS